MDGFTWIIASFMILHLLTHELPILLIILSAGLFFWKDKHSNGRKEKE